MENKIDVQSITPEMVLRVYSGKQGCTCSCNGKYWANPQHIEEANKKRGYPHEESEVSLRQVKRVLNLLKKDARARLERGYVVCVDWMELDENERVFFAWLTEEAKKTFQDRA